MKPPAAGTVCSIAQVPCTQTRKPSLPPPARAILPCSLQNPVSSPVPICQTHTLHVLATPPHLFSLPLSCSRPFLLSPFVACSATSTHPRKGYYGAPFTRATRHASRLCHKNRTPSQFSTTYLSAPTPFSTTVFCPPPRPPPRSPLWSPPPPPHNPNPHPHTPPPH